MVEFKQEDRSGVYFGDRYVSDFLKSKDTLKRERMYAPTKDYFIVPKELVVYNAKKYNQICIYLPETSKFKGHYFWIDKEKVKGFDVFNMYRMVRWRKDIEMKLIFRTEYGKTTTRKTTFKKLRKEFLNYQQVNDVFYDLYINNANEELVKLIDSNG